MPNSVFNDTNRGHALKKIGKNYTFWLAFLLFTVYQSYRYPLQVNTVGFSPNYSDTPFVLQAGKFLLAIPFLAICTLQWIRNSARIHRWPIVLATMFLSSYSLFKILGHPDSQYLDISFWILVCLMLVLSVKTVGIESLDRYLYFLLIYAFVSDVVQIILFAATGRLPSMASEGSYFVRFGAFLDDPNGFAALTFLLMGWTQQKFQGRKRFFILGALVLSLLLTQSWTAIGFFVAMLCVLGFVAAMKRPLLAVPTICAVPLLITSLVGWIQSLRLGLLRDVLEAKEGSIEGHYFPVARWASRWFEWAVFGDSSYNAYESWWPAAMINFGVLWFVVYLSLVAALVIYAWLAQRKANAEARPFYAGLLLFGIFFAIGSFGLPFPIKFPINVIFFVLSFLVAFDKIPAEGIPASSKPFS